MMYIVMKDATGADIRHEEVGSRLSSHHTLSKTLDTSLVVAVSGVYVSSGTL